MLGPLLRQEATAALAEIITETKPFLPELVDIDAMAVDLLSGENADRLARLMRTVGDHELRTVIRYGAVVGFFVGLAEAVVYLLFHRWWLLPAIGAVDGLVNNWMGIQMIFRPLQRTRYLGVFPSQGLFPKRQAEIAHDYAQMMANEVLTPTSLASTLADPDRLAPLITIAHDVLERHLGAQLAMLAPALGIEPTPSSTAASPTPPSTPSPTQASPSTTSPRRSPTSPTSSPSRPRSRTAS